MKGLKIGLVIVCFVSAGLVAMFSWGQEDVLPESDEFATNWKCEACDHQYKLSLSGYHAAMAQSNGAEPLKCPQCSKQKAWMVALCPTCQSWYFGPQKPGTRGICPVCNPEPEQLEDEIVEVAPDSPRRIMKSY